MISYELTEEQQIVQSTMSEFAREELFPHTRRLDDDACIDADLLSKLWSTGIVQAQADQEGRSPITNEIVLEELGAADATLAVAVASPLGFVGEIRSEARRVVKACVSKSRSRLWPRRFKKKQNKYDINTAPV